MVVEADPITEYATGVLQGLEAVAMNALVLERSDDPFDHAVLFGRIRGDPGFDTAISSPKCNSAFSGWKLRVDGLL